MLFKGKSMAERATLAQLKSSFGHRNMKTDVMNSFNEVEHFIRFVTEAYVTCLALQRLDMADLTSIPIGSLALLPAADRREYLQNVCHQVIETVTKHSYPVGD